MFHENREFVSGFQLALELHKRTIIFHFFNFAQDLSTSSQRTVSSASVPIKHIFDSTACEHMFESSWWKLVLE